MAIANRKSKKRHEKHNRNESKENRYAKHNIWANDRTELRLICMR